MFLKIIKYFPLVLVSQLAWSLDVHFDPSKQVYKSDPNTPGYTFANSLYQIKMNELSVLIPQIRNEEYKNKQMGLEDNAADLAVIERQINMRIAKAVKDRNLDLINKMNALPIDGVGQNSVSSLTKQQMLETLRSIESSPATDSFPEFKNQYDPKGNYGFCFGRAMYYFNAVAARGLDRAAIRKVFLVGKMMPLGIFPIGVWQFHVALTVRGQDGQWYVLDNHVSLDKVLTVKEWYERYNRRLGSSEDFDIQLTDGTKAKASTNALYLFFTDPIRVGMSGFGYNDEGYIESDLNKDGKIENDEVFYNGYFKALKDYFSAPIPRCSPLRFKPVDDKKICESEHMQKRNQLYDSKMEEWRKVFNQIAIDRALEELK